MKTKFLFLYLLVCTFSVSAQKVILLHHSTGEGVYVEGKVAEWFANYNSIHSTTYQVTERTFPNSPYPWENYPYDYWNLWINGGCNSDNPNIECMNTLCNNFNVIIYKHCFPGADILADDAVSLVSSKNKTLGNYKLQYRALRDEMDKYPQNKFIVWTLAPLHRLATNDQNAARAKQFVNWVKNEWLSEGGKQHPNIFIFDFWGYTAEDNPTPINGKVNCLKYVYEIDHSSSNSHPNLTANEYIGPKFGEFIVQVIQNKDVLKVTQIKVSGEGNALSITIDKGTLQMGAEILPADATNKTVSWSISSGSENATISSSGLLTATEDGVVTVKATAVDGSGVFGTKEITITGQTVKVSSVSIKGTSGLSSITVDKGSLQLVTEISPVDASNKEVTWSIPVGSELAGISNTGLLTAIKNGSITVQATARDGSGVSGTKIITITGQIVKVSTITVKGVNNTSIISGDKGTLQLQAEILPFEATDKTVSWSISSGSEYATISSSGLLTSIKNGVVIVKATALDGSGVFGTKEITITGQIVKVSSLIIKGASDVSSITADKGSLQLIAEISPVDASNKEVNWSLIDGSDLAEISNTGLLRAIKNGSVTVQATAMDGSGVSGTKIITITSQIIKVSTITVKGVNDTYIISADKGTLQMEAEILPVDATDKTIAWSISSGGEYGSISSYGLLTAIKNGVVTVKAIASDGSGTFGNTNITVSNQIVKATAVTLSGAGNLNVITTPGGTLQLNVAFTPIDVTDQTVTWGIVSGNLYGSVNSSGLVSALLNGSIRVSATANDGSGVQGVIDINITGQATSIDKRKQTRFSFYPNPSRDIIYLNHTEGIVGDISIYTITGVKIKEVDISDRIINISELGKGYYILVFSQGNNLYKEKLVIY